MMNKIKLIFAVAFATLFYVNVKAQTIEDGRKFLYYEKYISAKNTFQKILDANPANSDAAYWLGQTLLASDKDIAGAKAVYQKALMTARGIPMLVAGMGHIDLLEGKTQEARNEFETAISLSQGKNIDVLNAIGLANADFDSKLGDANYAIEKLNQATKIKGFKDPETYCLLGDAYRKFANGGDAITAYNNALNINKNYARAKYRIGRIYQTQGVSNQDVMMDNYNAAIALDPNYTPVYYTLFQYFYDINVTKSAMYLDKYLAAMGTDATNGCELKARLLYAQSLFQQAVDKAKECVNTQGATINPSLYGLMGYAYNRLNDSTNAKNYFEQFFAKQKVEKIGSGDYETFAKILLKFPGNETQAGSYIEKAIDADSTESGKITLIKSVANSYIAQKKYEDAANWYKKILTVKKNITITDLYNAGYNYYRVGKLQPAIEIFTTYTQKFPNDIFGHYMLGKSNWAIDTTMKQGLANPFFEKAISVGEAYTDKSKIISQLMGSYNYLIAYAVNIKKDKALALSYCDKALLIDPTDQGVITNKDAISKMNFNAKPATKPVAAPIKKPAVTAKPTAKPATKGK